MKVKELIKILEEKWGNTSCPMCGNHRWNTPPGFYAIKSITDYNSLPLKAVICENCGNTVLLNIKVLGIDDES